MSSRTTTTAWARNPEKDARRLADFDHSKYETYVVEAKNTYHVDEHHTVTYGGEYRKQRPAARALAQVPGSGQKKPI